MFWGICFTLGYFDPLGTSHHLPKNLKRWNINVLQPQTKEIAEGRGREPCLLVSLGCSVEYCFFVSGVLLMRVQLSPKKYILYYMLFPKGHSTA